MKQKKHYTYTYKGTIYFRKRIPKKYLHKSQDYIFRKSLKLSFRDSYYFLEKNKDELVKLTSYLSNALDAYLSLKRKLTMQELFQYFQELCEKYTNNAQIENSWLENKRIENIEYTDSLGRHQGYQIQAISRYYKEVLLQYNNLENKDNTIKLATKIIKHSNITQEQLLEIQPSQMISFYELLIKAEKKVIENDIKVYISRNLFQFTPLFKESNNESDKINEAYYNYLNLINQNPIQNDYLKFVDNQKPQNSNINREQVTKEVIEEIKKQQREESEKHKITLEELRNKYIKYKGFQSKKLEQAYTRATNLLIDYCNGNSTFEYPPREISEFTEEDFTKLEDLISNLLPRTKRMTNWTLFELYEYSLANPEKAKYEDGTMKNEIETPIIDFYIYLSKIHKHLHLDKDLVDVFSPSFKLNSISNESPQVRSMSSDELSTIIHHIYGEEKLYKILIYRPQHFYVFMLSMLYGMRIEEALLISMNDIKVQEKNGERIYYIYLCEDHNYQHLKNTNAHRNLAITELLKNLGFLDYVYSRHKQGKETLFDFPKSKSGTLSQFFQRNFKQCFPNKVATRENRDNNEFETFIQFKSLRKNFTNVLMRENRTNFDTDVNKKKILGHSTANLTGHYYGRLDPYSCYKVLNAINFEEELGIDLSICLTEMAHLGRAYKRELKYLKQNSSEEWMILNVKKRHKNRKIER